MKTTLFALATCLVAAGLHAETNDASTWNSKGAAAYLDQRSSWWITWQPAARDHNTFCISCHTALPYALGRPALRTALGEQGPSSNEQQLLDNVKKRVRLWSEVLPFYNDEKNGAPKTAEARGTEVVLNALILASYDARDGKLSDDGRLALDNMWGLQLKTGDKKGAWTWLNFHNEPWEADDSQFWGATLGALAAGNAPQDYRSTPTVQENIKMLAGYLQREQAQQSLINRTFLLWASTKLPDVLTGQQQKSIIEDLLAKQQADGGWSTTSIVIKDWKRRDGTPLDAKSDGYGTGLVTFVLERAGVSRNDAHLKQALGWLAQNQDNKAEGQWRATSLNKERDPASDAGRFMSDAATAYAVLALTDSK
jgi:squalene-hopene/tetraprenyl-beta-curcumene cyclase